MIAHGLLGRRQGEGRAPERTLVAAAHLQERETDARGA
jgi:hypothetical protein